MMTGGEVVARSQGSESDGVRGQW